MQGATVGLIDSTGSLVVEYNYDAWGKIIGRTGSLVGTLGWLNRGYVYDEETGLYYLRSRYYNPEWGRFINADVILGETGEVLTTNIYAYCRNNPIAQCDSNGLFGVLALIGAAVGAVSGVVGQVISDVITSCLTGEATVSSVQTYAGALIGGVASGVTFA